VRITFEPKRKEVTEVWRRLHNEELHNLFSSPQIIRVIKSKRMRYGWRCYTLGRDEMRNAVFTNLRPSPPS
jgi:hypothetical protein